VRLGADARQVVAQLAHQLFAAPLERAAQLATLVRAQWHGAGHAIRVPS
jgi:hypothetical protein